MRYASVCDGIGAVHVAWQPLGWHCEWTAEIDAFPAAVVEQRWGFPNRGDMTRFRDWGDLDVDLLVGGTPCQAFSVAGLRRSLEDERGNLSLVFVNLMDAIDEERKRLGKPPAICVWENVPGVLSTKDNAFGCFLAGLAGEGVPLQPSGGKWSNAGYVLGPKRAVAWRVLDAQYFGVAQRRRRVFLVASARDGFSPAAVLFEPEGLRRDNPPSRAKGQGATYDVAPCIGASGRGFERAGETRGQDPVVAQPYRIANCLTRRMHKGINTTCDEGQTPVLAPQAFYSNESRCDGIPVPDLAPPLKVGSNGGGQPPAVAFSAKDHGGDASEEVAPTMRSMGHDGSHANGGGQLAVAFTKAKRAQSTTDDESWVPGDVAPTFNCFDQGDTRATTVVVRGVAASIGQRMRGQDDSCADNLQVVAFANRTRDGIKVPEVMKDGVTPAPTNPGDGGRSDAVNVVVPQAQAFTHSGYSNKPAWITGDRTDCLPSSGHGDTSHQGIGVMQAIGFDGFQSDNPKATHQATSEGTGPLIRGRPHCVATALAVRRLTPRECERLQGFPDDYTAIEYRNKPAADGPRYKALGNSMAVPVMAWMGRRIQAAK